MTEISATALIKTGSPISVFSLNVPTPENKYPIDVKSSYVVNSPEPNISSTTHIQTNRRKIGCLPHKLSAPNVGQNLDHFMDQYPAHDTYNKCIKLEKYENHITGSDQSSLMFHPVLKERSSASSSSGAAESSYTAAPAKKNMLQVTKELNSGKTEPTGFVKFRTRNQVYKKKGGLKYPPLISPLGYEYVRQGTAAIGLDTYVCSKRKTSRCQARVRMNQNQTEGEFTHREHNHCATYWPFHPNCKANPKLRPGACKTRQQPKTPTVLSGEAKPEWEEPPGRVQFECRQSTQKNWRGGMSRMLISKLGYEYRRRKGMSSGISEYACNRKNGELYCSVRLEIHNDDTVGVFVTTQHNHPPKYPVKEISP